ncbi:MAG: hypothetical protein AB8G99_06855 [Planctomycetaceae bacterium]
MPRTHKYGMLAITLCGSLAAAAVAQQSPYPVAQNSLPQAVPNAGAVPTPGAGGTVGQIPAPSETPALAPMPVPDAGIPITAPPPLVAQPAPALAPAPAPAPFANTPGPVATMPHVSVPATASAGCGTAGCTTGGCGTTAMGCGSTGCGSVGCGGNSCGQGNCNYRPIFGNMKPYDGCCNNGGSLIDRIQAKFKGGLLGKMMNGDRCMQGNGCSTGGCFSGSCLSKLGSGSCLSGSCLSKLGNGSCFGKLGSCGLLGGSGCSLLSGSCLGGGCLGGGCNSGGCNSGGCNNGSACGGGGCGFASLGKKAYPDSGWAPPASVPIIRNNAQYTNWWPQQWYGSPGFAATPYPMVYMPTDTTQLGFGYMQVPYWQRRAGSYPPIPDAAMYHTRTAPMPAPYGYSPVYQPVTLPPHSRAQRSRTGWLHGSTTPATSPRQQVAQRPQSAPRMSPEQMERARQYQAQRQQQARDYQAAMRRSAASNVRPVSSSSPR